MSCQDADGNCTGHYAEWACDCGQFLARKRSLTPSIDWLCAACQDKSFERFCEEQDRLRQSPD
jgi:hypothetical protein